MKAYRVQSILTDNIFYVGYKRDVDETLRTYFSTHFQQSLRKHQLKLKALQEKQNQKDHSQTQQSQSSYDSSQPESLNSTLTEPQYIVLHIMLFDLTLQQYNGYNEEISQKYQPVYKNTALPVKINVLFVSSREQSLKYVRKIQKMMGQQFEKNLMYLHSEWEKTQQYELIRNYLMEKFQWSREEAFEWMTQNNVNTLDQLFVLKDIPNYQKKQIKKLIQNLALLQELCKD